MHDIDIRPKCYANLSLDREYQESKAAVAVLKDSNQHSIALALGTGLDCKRVEYNNGIAEAWSAKELGLGYVQAIVATY